MKKNEAFYKVRIVISAVGYLLLSQAYSQNFKPSHEPIFSTPQAKPNIHLVLDDSGSMSSRDIRLRPGGQLLTRSQALQYAFENLFYKYRDKAYLGVTFLRQGNNERGMIRQPLSDLSTMTESDFKNQVIDPLGRLILNAPGHTPMYAGVYETFKMFRGYPVMQGYHGNAWRKHHMVSIQPSPVGRGNDRYFPAIQLETPLRYRCQSNHLILMTDGDPYGYDVWGIPDEDIKPFSASNSFLGAQTNKHSFNGIELTYDISFEGAGTKNRQILGRQMANTDLRYAQKLVQKNGVWQTKVKDDAGRDWNDPLSVKMPINTHSVSLYVKKDSPIYTDLTAPSKGMNLGVEQGSNGSAEDLLSAFDTIFASIIRSTSSSFAKNDRTYADVLDGVPPMKNGKVDLSKIGAIRYDTIYNFRQQFGSLRAVVPYKTDEVLPNGKKKTNTVIVWDTNETIKAKQGQYVTFLDTNKNGLEINTLDSAETKKQFTNILKKSQNDPKAIYDQKYIQWLTDFKNAANSGLRGRLNPMGSITNSDIQLVNKDVLHINVVSQMMSIGLSKELINYLLYKAKFQPKNYIIVSDNDGFINFINAERGLTGAHKGGERDTAYFPQLLVKQLPEITKPDSNATLVLEGKTRIVDGKVYQPGIGNIYATIGLTTMGTGGHGIVGYRLFGASEKSVKDWAISKGSMNTNQAIMSKVTPLFEIDGSEKKSGYELGYTYSDFEVFNRMIKQQGEERGQIVAVFGNGMADKSKLYFMDAYTGEKLHSIDLPGMSAMAISSYVRNDTNGKGQKLDRLYVGDYLGSLYRIDFKGQDFTDDAKTEITHLFQAPQHITKKYQSAITAKPLVIRNDTTGLFGIYFGTGVANNHERDRGDNAAVEHAIYGITDRNKTSSYSTVIVADLKRGYKVLPLLSVDQLKEGEVSYRDGTNIDYNEIATHDLYVTTPTDKPNQGARQDGWYMRLIADGTKSGERIIQAPKYDEINKAVVFSTWGISERYLPYDDNGLYDPCLADLAFGKTLSFDIATGAAGKTPRSNKGQTNNALGLPTGDAIIDSPTGNTTTDINQLETIVQEMLLDITGEDNSTHVTDKDSSAAYCYTSINGEVICEEDERDYRNITLEKGRISIQILF